MRADRLLSLVLLLQARPGRSAPELAERLGVSVRTVLRDVDALSTAGIPVYTERGRTGGIRLLDTYRGGAANLSKSEAAGLAVGQPRLAEDLGLGVALDTAIEKITGAGGQRIRGGRVLVDVDPWMRTGESVPLLPRVHDGLNRGRRLDLAYRDSEKRERRVSVHPLGLVAKAGVWYLVARPDDAPDPALFRVGRIRGCEVSADAADRPDDFDLETEWGRLRNRVEVRQRDLAVTVVLDPPTRVMVQRLLANFTRGSDGGRLDLTFASIEHAVASLLGLTTKVTVIEPQVVRDAIHDAAEELVRRYPASG